MKLQSISLQHLFTDGSFGSVVLGMGPEQVKLLLGKATDEYHFGLLHPMDRIEWIYGNISFLFINQVLEEIAWQPNLCSYDACLPDAGLISLDPWIIWNGLTIPEAERELMHHSVNFRKVEIPKGLTYEGDRVVELITSCNARLIFRGYLDWHLESFSLSNRFQIDTPIASMSL